MRPLITSRVPRDVEPLLSTLLTEEPAILVEGARGSGKSTILARAAADNGVDILDLDDERSLSFVRNDPTGALTSDRLVIIDEFQRAPEVLSVVKRLVDQRGRAGQFLLAGSVSAGLLPLGAETLTGRVQRRLIPPLSTSEVLAPMGYRWLPHLLEGEPPHRVDSDLSRADYFRLVGAGGFPAALRRPTDALRRRWLTSYLSSVADRDLAELVDLRNPGLLARIYRAVASSTSAVLVRAAFAQRLEVRPATLTAYLDLLCRVHLIQPLPAWTSGLSAKPGKRPKFHVTDTGLGAAAIGLDPDRLSRSDQAGNYLESYVLGEVVKQVAALDGTVALGHFRERSGIEVDLVLEQPDGSVIALEVKSATRVNEADARGLRFLRDRLGTRFRVGLLLHTGPHTVSMGDQLWAAPISALWTPPGAATTPTPRP